MVDTAGVTQRLIDLSHANHYETWRMMARLAPDCAIEEGHDVVCIHTGAPISFFNPVFVTRPPSDPDAVVAGAQRFFAGRKVPWLIRSHGAAAEAIGPAARAAGMVPGGPVPGMVLPALEGAPPAMPGLEIRVVDHDTFDAYNATVAAGFGMPLDILGPLLNPEMLELPGVTLYVGYMDGGPVATSARVSTHRIAGVYNVSTLPEYRRRGLGEAMTWRAALDGRDEGCIASSLQASEMGFPVYERMGYRYVVQYETWDLPPRAVEAPG